MTDFDYGSLDRLLPATPGPADWDDVLSRSGAHQRPAGWSSCSLPWRSSP
jgi:hypothetical protein